MILLTLLTSSLYNPPHGFIRHLVLTLLFAEVTLPALHVARPLATQNEKFSPNDGQAQDDVEKQEQTSSLRQMHHLGQLKATHPRAPAQVVTEGPNPISFTIQ